MFDKTRFGKQERIGFIKEIVNIMQENNSSSILIVLSDLMFLQVENT